MPQAKTLKESEFKKVLLIISTQKHAHRNRVAFLLSFWSGMRVGEIASLKINDVIENDGGVKSEIVLKPNQTKGNHSRKVMIAEKLRKELSNYIKSTNVKDVNQPLIYSQRNRNGFNSLTLSQEFKRIYAMSNIDGATSHSGRRTFITNLANRGVGVRVLQALAGHRSIATTQIYIDVNDDILRTAVDLI